MFFQTESVLDGEYNGIMVKEVFEMLSRWTTGVCLVAGLTRTSNMLMYVGILQGERHRVLRV